MLTFFFGKIYTIILVIKKLIVNSLTKNYFFNQIIIQMSKTQIKIDNYIANTSKIGVKIDADLLTAVTKGLGPSIHLKDAECVSCGDQSELDRVKKNFLIKKLGLDDSPALDAAIKEVCEEMGKSNRTKYRAIFYALLVVKFKKQSVYGM